MEVLDDVVLVVEERPSYQSNIFTEAGRVVGFPHNFASEVHLLHGNHVAETRYVVEHATSLFVPGLLFFHKCY